MSEKLLWVLTAGFQQQPNNKQLWNPPVCPPATPHLSKKGRKPKGVFSLQRWYEVNFFPKISGLFWLFPYRLPEPSDSFELGNMETWNIQNWHWLCFQSSKGSPKGKIGPWRFICSLNKQWAELLIDHSSFKVSAEQSLSCCRVGTNEDMLPHALGNISVIGKILCSCHILS